MVTFTGEVFSGIGKGKYYVGHPEYQKRFKAALGYTPYPGTLNVRLLDQRGMKEAVALRSQRGVKIESFAIAGETFSGLNCFDGKMRDERITLLFIEITLYNESVLELISPVYLRGSLELKDGDKVHIEVHTEDARSIAR